MTYTCDNITILHNYCNRVLGLKRESQLHEMNSTILWNSLKELRKSSPGVLFRQEQKPILRFYNCVIFSVADRQI